MTTFANNSAMDHQWHAVAEGSTLGSKPVAVRLLSVDYVLWRTPDGRAVAALDRCPHRECPLSLGSVSKGTLTCAYHGWSFADGGKCVTIPSNQQQDRSPPAANLELIEAEERYGLVWLCPGDPVGTIPTISHEDDPDYRRINTGVVVWKTSATRMTDNFMDISHFPWVHTGTIGDSQDTQVPKLEVESLDDDWFGYAYEVTAINPVEAQLSSASNAETVHRSMTTGFHLPFSVRSTIAYESGLEHILLILSTPIDDETSYFTFVVWRNDDFSSDPQEVVAFDRAIGDEDKRMLERIPGALSLTKADLVNVQSDKASAEWRRRLVDFLE